MTYDTQQVLTGKSGTPVEVRVVIGGVNDKNWGKNIDMQEED